jgi:hypothetical protein
MKSRGKPWRFFVSESLNREIILPLPFTIILLCTDRHCRKMAFVVSQFAFLGLAPLGCVAPLRQRRLAPNSRRIGFHMRDIKVELSRDCYQGRCDRLVPSFLQGV